MIRGDRIYRATISQLIRNTQFERTLMKKTQTSPTTQKQLRAIAREALAKFLRHDNNDVNVANLAVQALHAPQHRGE